MYSKDYLATHTLAGGNAAKESLDPEVVRAITGKLLLYYLCACN